MPSWPSIGRAEDRQLAQSLREGEPDALVLLYDTYAARLYDYCHALLRDQAVAAAAVHDSLLAAQAHVGGLREPELLRSWLYALARNECLRRLTDPATPVERHEAPEADNAFLSAQEKAQREETRQVVHSALAGLSGRQREAVDLAVRHDLDVAELANVLGISADQCNDLAAGAREQFADALVAVTLARTARDACPGLAALADQGGWPIDPATCQAIVDHVRHCPACEAHRRDELSTSSVLQVLPIAAMPHDLRPQVLTSASSPEMTDERVLIARRAEPFDDWGWPASQDRGPVSADAHSGFSGRLRQGAPRLWPALAAAAGVFLIVGAVFFLLPGSSDDKPDSGKTQAKPSAPVPSDSLTLSPTKDTSTPTPTKKKETPTPTPTSTTPRPTTSAPKPRLSVSGGGTIAPGQSRTATLKASSGKGTVRWTARASEYLNVSASSGQLSAGSTRSVSISLVDQEGACAESVRSGSVSFSPGGSVKVTWLCPDH